MSLRTIAKNVNFGVFYGLFPRGLQRTLRFKAGLDKSLSECEGIISNLKAGYPNLSRWQEQARHAAATRQYTQTFLGRRRYLPGIRSQDWGRKSFAERCALNTPIQGTAADIIKIAMINVEKALKDAGLCSKLILQIHDELIVEAPESEAQRAAEILKHEMEHAVELSVPLTADCHTGKTWFEAKE